MKMGIRNKLIHLVQLLHLKTNADLKKLEKEVAGFEKSMSSEAHYVIQSYLVDVHVYEFLKRETLDAYKTILTDAPHEYAREKFIKDSKFDRETIGRH